jgi:NAD(P)-dependent dehydrogenase (short-subunit alcohol dehydrogenase family)
VNGEKPHEIGRQDCALAKEGADVTIAWLDDEPAAEAMAGRIRQAGRRVHLIRADVARLADIDAMVADTTRVLGAPDILVNNAGVYPRVKLLEMRKTDWNYLLDINLKADCFAAIAFVKALFGSGEDSGSIADAITGQVCTSTAGHTCREGPPPAGTPQHVS